jgi:hypothetical protein
VGRVVRDTTLNGGKKRKIFGCEVSQAVPAHPSGKGRLERRQGLSKLEKVRAMRSGAGSYCIKIERE